MTVPHLHIALAIVWHEGRVLIARRRDDAEHLPGIWEFPGGKCEDGETLAQCAIREAREEIGVAVKIIRERAKIHHEYSERRVSLHPFDCEIIGGEPQALGCTGWRWAKPEELRDEDCPAANVPLLNDLRKSI